MKIFPFTAVAALALFCSTAFGNVILSSTTSTASSTFPLADTLLLQQFDPSLGTLQSITISLIVKGSEVTTFTNNSETNTIATISSHVELVLQLGNTGFSNDLATDSNAPANPWLDANLAPHTATSLGPLTSATFNSSFTKSATSTPITAGTVFSQLQGLGTVALNFTANGTFWSTTSDLGNTDFSNVVTGYTSAIVSYDYNPLTESPEPGTMIMSMIPIIGIVTIGMRRKGAAGGAVRSWLKSRFARRS